MGRLDSLTLDVSPLPYQLRVVLIVVGGATSRLARCTHDMKYAPITIHFTSLGIPTLLDCRSLPYGRLAPLSLSRPKTTSTIDILSLFLFNQYDSLGQLSEGGSKHPQP